MQLGKPERHRLIESVVSRKRVGTQFELLDALAGLEGRQEWGVKLLLDPAQVAAEARLGLPDGEAEAATDIEPPVLPL